jgi:thiol-disulfide isomerase/thioredoxin
MATDAPVFSGQDILGGPAFDLAAHKGSYVFVAFMGLPWCGPCKLELPHLVAVANEYAAGPPTPAVDFVIVNMRESFQNSAVATYATDQGVTMPIIDDDYAILVSYAGNYGVPQSYIVTPSGALCDSHMAGSGTAEELMNLLLDCGAPTPGSSAGIGVIDWGSQPPPVLTFPPPPPGLPKEFPTPIRVPPPWPKPLGLMSRAVVRALAIHDAATGLAHHEASTTIRSAALKAAAASLRRMESLAALEAEIGPLPPNAVEVGKAARRKAE